MMKILKRILVFVLLITLTFTNITKIYAASGKISVSSSTSKIVVGKTFTVTVKVSASIPIGTWEYSISYDKSKFKLESGQSYVADYGNGSKTSATYTYKFKAIATGSGKITVSNPLILDYKDESKISASVGSTTVKVITQAELESSYSKNNNLSSLSVEGYTLEPKFNSSTLEYKVDAGANVEKVTVKATKEDSKASIAGTGTHEVSEGENKINITVTAENGSTKTYTLLINVTDPNPINVTINDKEYVIIKREGNLKSPENYTKKTITINEQQIPAFYNEINNYTLVGLKDKDGNNKLFIYDENNNTYTEYNELLLNQMKIIPLPIDKTFDNYKKELLTINENIYEALKLNNSDIYIIHARDLETGKDDYYSYDKETNTIIRYNEDILLPYKKELKKLDKYEKIIILLLTETVIVFILLIILLISNIKKKKKNNTLKEEYIKRLNEQKQEKIKERFEKNNKEENEEEIKESSKEEIEESNTKNNKTKDKKRKSRKK